MKIEVANGEVIDKITILRIKESKIKDEVKLKNIKNELHELLPIMKEMGLSENSEHYKKLMDINIKLWNVEDNLRDTCILVLNSITCPKSLPLPSLYKPGVKLGVKVRDPDLCLA